MTSHSAYKVALNLGPHEHRPPNTGPAWGACDLCGLWKKSRIHRGQSVKIRRGSKKKRTAKSKCVEIACPACEGKGVVFVSAADLGSFLLRQASKG